MKTNVVIAHNLRSTHNVGSLLRTAEGLGVAKLYLSGHTPYPTSPDDNRLPHLSNKIHNQIHKTALGAETSIPWEHIEDVLRLISQLKQDGYTIAALEQTTNSIALPNYSPPQKLAIVLGREVEGVEAEILAECDVCLEIPMRGHKESYNVVQAAAMALYHATFFPFNSPK